MDDDKIAKKDKFVFGFGILITILVLFTSSFLFLKYSNFKKPVVEEEKLEVVEVPIETIKPEVSYKKTPIKVLNASGISGVAKKYADGLEKLGYSNVSTGNYEKIVTGNLLFAPEDTTSFKADLTDIDFINYEFEKSEDIKVVVGK